MNKPRDKLAKRAAEAEQRLSFANSYTRADAIVDCFLAGHPRAVELLGDGWSMCDFYPPIMGNLLRRCRSEHSYPLLLAMSDEERAMLAALPDPAEVWRGCYAHNRAGFSWSLDRKVAARFPTLNRYRHDGTPLLLRGLIAKPDVAFLKLGREEAEVVALPDSVVILEEIRLEQAA